MADQGNSELVHLEDYVSYVIFLSAEIVNPPLLLHILLPPRYRLQCALARQVSHQVLHCLTLKPCFRLCKLKSQPVRPLCIVLLLYPLSSQVEHLLLSVNTLDKAEFGRLLPPVLEVGSEFCEGVYSLPYLMGLQCPPKGQPDLCHMDIVLEHLVVVGDLLSALGSLLQMQLQDLIFLLHPLILADFIAH